MKRLYLLLHRIQSHMKNHRVVLIMFFAGIITSVLFFTYYYGDFVKASKLIQGHSDIMATFKIKLNEPILATDERIAQLEEKYEVTLYHTAVIDIEKSSQIFSDYFLENKNYYITYMARKGNHYKHSSFYGSTDVTMGDVIVLSDSEPSYMYDVETYKSLSEAYLILDGKKLMIAGVHNYAYEPCVSYEYMINNNIAVNQLDVMSTNVMSTEAAVEFAESLKELFPEASVDTPYDIYYDKYLKGEEEHRPVAMANAVMLLVISVITFMFLVKYLFDMSKSEDVVYRIVGASRADVTLIALLEIIVLTLTASVAAVIIHILLYKPLFSVISQYPNQIFDIRDYALVVLVVLLVSVVTCIPFIISVWRKSVIQIKKL